MRDSMYIWGGGGGARGRVGLEGLALARLSRQVSRLAISWLR